MSPQGLALLLEQEHDEIDCCPLHFHIFGEAIALITLQRGTEYGVN